jgi:hypothetical protein
MNKGKVGGLAKFPHNKTRRLKAMSVENQEKGRTNSSLSSCFIKAAYNHHSHTSSSCYGKAKKMQQSDNITTKKKGKLVKNPQQKKRQTIAKKEACKMVLWDGSCKARVINCEEVCVSK